MPLPWNRADPHDSSDSWASVVPVVGRLVDSGTETRAPERSRPTRVADPHVSRADGLQASPEQEHSQTVDEQEDQSELEGRSDESEVSVSL